MKAISGSSLSAWLFRLPLLLVPLLIGCAVAHYYGSIKGRVVDRDTGQPLEGAAVVAMYRTVYGSLGGEVTRFEDAQEAKTDANGEFSIPGIFVFAPRPPFSWFNWEPEFCVYQPEYGQYSRGLGDAKATRLTKEDGCQEFRLPRLMTLEARREGALLWPTAGLPRSKAPHLVTLMNMERKAIGLPKIEE